MEKVILIAINERLFKLGLINEETRNKVFECNYKSA